MPALFIQEATGALYLEESSDGTIFLSDGRDAQSVNIAQVVATSPASEGGYTPHAETQAGSDLSGVSGTKGRIMTLSNTSETLDGVLLLFRNGSLIHPSSLTITDKENGTTVEIDEYIFDEDIILANYFTG